MRHSRFQALLPAFLLAVSASALAQTESGAPVAPGSGEPVMAVVVDSDRVMVTTNGGATWRMMDASQAIEFRVGSPVQLTRLVAATRWGATDANTTASSPTVAIPNPASRMTTIHFSIEEPMQVTLVLLDMAGKEVARREANLPHVGEQELSIDLTEVPAGSYHYRIVCTSRLTRGGGLLLVR